MKHVLIISEDIVKIQTLTGIFGKSFKLFYLNWLKLRLKLLIIILSPFYKVTVVCSDYYKFNNQTCFYYGQELASINYAKNRKIYQKVLNRLLKNTQNGYFLILNSRFFKLNTLFRR